MYVHSSPLVRKLITLADCNSHFLSQIDLGSINRLDETGSSLRYTTEELSWKIVNGYLSNKKLKISGYFENEDYWSRIIHSWYLTRLRQKTELYFLMKNFVKSKNSGKKVKIYFESFPLFKDWISKMPEMRSLSVSQSVNLFELFQPFLLIGRVVFDLVIAYTNFFEQRTNITTENNKPKIFVEYVSHIFSRYPHAGFLFWYPHTELDKERVVLYFDRKDDVFKTNVNDVETHGFSWVELNSRYKSKVNLLKLIKMFFKVQLPSPLKRYDINLYIVQLYLVFIVEWYRGIIKKYNIKVVHQHQECWPVPLCLALAVKKEHGIFVWNHWSVDHFPISYFNAGFADLVFSWGEYNNGYFDCQNYKYDYMVQTGLIAGENILSSDMRNGKSIRKNFSSQVTFVFTILDSSHSVDHLDSTTKKVLEFYNWVLTYIRTQPDCGIIIQSKGNSFERIEKDTVISSELNELMSMGRCIISEKNSRIVPSCLAADLCICFTINSAGIIAGLAGQRVIYWDVSGELAHPLYKLKVDKNIIFKNLKDIEKQLQRYKIHKKNIGDHDKWISIIDNFRDGKGPKRAGEVIDAFMNGIDQGKSKKTALRDAVESYKIKWGEDKVSEFGKISENRGSKVWRDVKLDTSNKLHNLIKKVY